MLDGFGMLLKSMGIDPVALMKQFSEFESQTKKVALDVAAKIDTMDKRLERIETLLLKRDADMLSHLQGVTPAGNSDIDNLFADNLLLDATVSKTLMLEMGSRK